MRVVPDTRTSSSELCAPDTPPVPAAAGAASYGRRCRMFSTLATSEEVLKATTLPGTRYTGVIHTPEYVPGRYQYVHR